MAKTYTWVDNYKRIEASSDDPNDPLTFDDIVDYFTANPLSADYDMPRRLGGSPYELCENNSSEWQGVNGMGTPSDDAVDYTKNSYSIKCARTGNPVTVTSTRVQSSSSYIYVYLSDTSSFSDGDEVEITSGTTNFNGLRFRINTISTNNYIRGYLPKGFTPDINEQSITATITKPLMLAWNHDLAQSHFYGSFADKFRFSAKTDGAGTVKIKAVIMRTYYGSGSTGYKTSYGAYYDDVEFTLTSSWQDFEFDIRDARNYRWDPPNDYQAGARGYWYRFKILYFVIDGLAIGENIWLDGVRISCADRNPKRYGLNKYLFTTPIKITGHFKDFGFDVEFRMLEVKADGDDGITFSATNLGDIELGDYSAEYTDKEGGVFFYNCFSREGTDGVELTNCYVENVVFMYPKGAYGAASWTGNGTKMRDCTFINLLNFMSQGTGWEVKDSKWFGGRYFIASSNPVTLDNVTAIGTSSYPIWPLPKSDGSVLEMRNIKIVDSSTSKYVLYSRDYGYTADRNIKIVNFDVSECDNPRYRCQSNYSSYGNHLYIDFTVDLKVKDEQGNPISGATVEIIDVYGNQVFSVTTDANGNIATQDVYILYYYDATQTINVYFDQPDTWTKHYAPYTLRVKKAGYRIKEDIVLKDGYDRTDTICKKGLNWEITLTKNKVLNLSNVMLSE